MYFVLEYSILLIQKDREINSWSPLTMENNYPPPSEVWRTGFKTTKALCWQCVYWSVIPWQWSPVYDHPLHGVHRPVLCLQRLSGHQQGSAGRNTNCCQSQTLWWNTGWIQDNLISWYSVSIRMWAEFCGEILELKDLLCLFSGFSVFCTVVCSGSMQYGLYFLEVNHYFIQTDLHPVLEQLTTLEMSGPVHTGIVIHSYTQI